jgi:hypothetical protein
MYIRESVSLRVHVDGKIVMCRDFVNGLMKERYRIVRPQVCESA